MTAALKIAIATAAYGLMHTLLASRTLKEAVTVTVGENNYRAFYRPFYVLQALASTVILFRYTSRLHTRTLYQVRGLPAACMRAGQVAALLHGYGAAREVGLLRITGADGMLQRLRGLSVPGAPVAQGPERDIVTGRLTAGGPFAWSRHPLNFTAVPLFWLSPKLTTGRLAFNVVATVYLVLGSLHEERRLQQGYGREYWSYLRSGPAFFLPRLRSRTRQLHIVGEGSVPERV